MRQCGKEYRYYDFATRYRVGFAPLPAFRNLSKEEHQAKVADLVREIEEEGAQARDGDSVAGRRKILMQNPYEPPTRKTKGRRSRVSTTRPRRPAPSCGTSFGSS